MTDEYREMVERLLGGGGVEKFGGKSASLTTNLTSSHLQKIPSLPGKTPATEHLTQITNILRQKIKL
jgi:hypothetical protein